MNSTWRYYQISLNRINMKRRCAFWHTFHIYKRDCRFTTSFQINNKRNSTPLIPSPVFPPLSFSPYPFQPGLWSPWKGRNYGYTWTIPDFRVSGNFWLVSFKISYLCLPLFYEPRTTPSCHPSGCAYRQLWYCQFRQECWPFWYLSWWKKSFSKIDFHNVLVVLWTVI